MVSKLLDAIRMYLSSKKKDDAWDYVDKLLIENSIWSTRIKTNLLLILPVGKRTFAITEKQSADVQREYWHSLYQYPFLSEESNEAQYAAQKFLENDRPFAALAAVSQYLERDGNNKLDVNLIAKILKKIINAPTDIESPLNFNARHHLLKAIRFIDNSQELSENEIVQIEWALLPIFRYDEFIPNRLSRIVATDPSVFAQLVIWAFRSEKDRKTDRVLDDETQNRAEVAHILLDKLSIIPGSSDGTGINTGVLNQWVNEVRRLLEEADRRKIGDDQIGNYLSNSPIGSDGVWPHETIRDVIEMVKSDQLDIGFRVGRQNSRGMTTRNPYDGGAQERVLAAAYFQDAKMIELKYPRTAGILREIAHQYEMEAEQQDRESELRE